MTIEIVNTIDERRSKIVINGVFYCYLSPDWRQMAIENTVSNDLFSYPFSSIVKIVFDCRLSGVDTQYKLSEFIYYTTFILMLVGLT